MAADLPTRPTLDPSRTAAQIRALIAGTLAPSVDPRALFVVDLTSSADRRHLASTLERANPKHEVLAKPAADDPVLVLAEARAEFLRLPSAQRIKILGEHEAARAALELQATTLATKQHRLSELRAKVAKLQAFLAGTLPVDVDPRSLLQVDLGAEGEIGLAATRRQSFLALLDGAATTPATGGSGAGSAAGAGAGIGSGNSSDEPDLRLAEARSELDALRIRFVDLSDAARDALFADLAHRRAVAAAPPPDPVDEKRASEDAAQSALAAQTRTAAEDKARALAAAKRAATESARQLEEAKAALHATVAQQAQLEAALLRHETALDAIHDLALTWDRKVKELAAAGDASAAERGYDELVDVLTTQRKALAQALDALDAPSEVPRAPVDGPLDASLIVLRTSVEATAQRLEALERKARWDRATTARDAIVEMNRDRLRLLAALGSARRGTLQGFGAEGRAQASRELHQISLEVRFHIAALPRLVMELVNSYRERPLDTAKSALLLIALLGGFRWWRRRAPRLLARSQVRPTSRAPVSRAKQISTTTL
ncbi:MAG: hypothetical protein ABJE66_30375 [Deltaproteobacteria bacterium]